MKLNDHRGEIVPWRTSGRYTTRKVATEADFTHFHRATQTPSILFTRNRP